MRIGRMILGTLAAAALLAGCKEKEEELGAPSIKVNPAELTFTQESGAESVEVTATRDWTAESDAEWAKVEPASGAIGTSAVTVTVLENTETDRTANITFRSTNGTVTTKLAVKQAGPGGAVEDTYVYFNNFDKTAASKGSDGWDTWLDSFDGWKNETGSGISSVQYASSGASARTVSMDSASDMSLYDGSGVNNIFFGKDAYFQIGNITLPEGTVNYALSFGSERYDGTAGADNTFNHDEFQVYISNDGQKWVELEYTFAKGSDPVGKWDLASSVFTVPSGTSALYIYFKVNKASVYRIDDLKLATSSAAGTEIDFSKGTEIGDDPVVPGDIKDVTVAEFLAAPVSTTEWYRLKGTVGGPINTQYGNFDIIDETGKVYVYGTSNFKDFTVNEGDNITIVGQRGEYNGKDEVLEAYIEEVVPGENPDPEPEPGDGEFASEFTWTLGESSYTQDAVVNDETTTVLKLGKSKGKGTATLNLASDVIRIQFYAMAWKGDENTSLVFSNADTGEKLGSLSIKSNVGATGNPTYNITVSDSDLYEFGTLGVANVAVTTEGGDRALIFGIRKVSL